MNTANDHHLSGQVRLSMDRTYIELVGSDKFFAALEEVIRRRNNDPEVFQFVTDSQVTHALVRNDQDTDCQVGHLQSKVDRLERLVAQQTEILYQFVGGGYKNSEEDSKSVSMVTDFTSGSQRKETEKIITKGISTVNCGSPQSRLRPTPSDPSFQNTKKILLGLDTSSIQKDTIVLLSVYLLQLENSWHSVSCEVMKDLFAQSPLMTPNAVINHLSKLHSSGALTKQGKGKYKINQSGWKRLTRHPYLYVHLQSLPLTSSQTKEKNHSTDYSTNQLFSILKSGLQKITSLSDQLLFMVYILQIFHRQPTIQRSQLQTLANHFGIAKNSISSQLNSMQRGDSPLLFRKGKGNYSITQLGLDHLKQALL